jgi:hypothetical protein
MYPRWTPSTTSRSLPEIPINLSLPEIAEKRNDQAALLAGWTCYERRRKRLLAKCLNNGDPDFEEDGEVFAWAPLP